MGVSFQLLDLLAGSHVPQTQRFVFANRKSRRDRSTRHRLGLSPCNPVPSFHVDVAGLTGGNQTEVLGSAVLAPEAPRLRMPLHKVLAAAN